MHQDQTFMVAQPLGPVYNKLIVFDPHNYPQSIGDLATSWTVADAHVTYTLKLHEGVKFHDGSDLTSADVKASWDKIIFPPERVTSPRRSYDQMIKRIEAPDRHTVVFRLHHPSPSFFRVWPSRPTSSMPKSTSIQMPTTIKPIPSAPDPSR
jgi:peptide/nickel transport system substrate-binding protein